MRCITQGANLFCKYVKGEGEYNFLFLHNAGGGHRFFQFQVDALIKFGDCYLLDLPGHGKSSCINSNGVDSFALEVSSFVEKQKLKNICLIGLNFGAILCIEIALKKHFFTKAIILLDPPICMSDDLIDGLKDHIASLKTKFSIIEAKIKMKIHFKKVGDAIIDIAAESFLNANSETLIDLYTSLIDWDRSFKCDLSSIHCPILCLLSNQELARYEDMIKLNCDMQIGQVVGSKYWLTLEVPDQTNSMICRFLQLL